MPDETKMAAAWNLVANKFTKGRKFRMPEDPKRLEPQQLREHYIADMLKGHEEGTKALFAELDDRALLAEEAELEVLHSHPDMCLERGKKQAVKQLKSDFEKFIQGEQS